MRNAIFAMLVCAFSSIDAAQVTVVRAGRLVDPDSGTALIDQVIVVDGGRIQAVGKGLAIPARAKVIDLSDKTVLPGFIDCHTHLVDGLTAVNGEPFNVVKKTAAQMVLGAVPNAEKTLLSGFTSVRDVGVYRALTDIALRDAISHGDIVGPRMYVAGAYVTITGGAGAMTGQAPDVQLPWDLHYGEANSPWEVRQKVRMLAHDGVDHIKVLSTGGVLTHGSSPIATEFTLEELQAAVEEAHAFGLRVEAHAHNAQGI
jgi:imidazolonepropionase-like amidohydrolase